MLKLIDAKPKQTNKSIPGAEEKARLAGQDDSPLRERSGRGGLLFYQPDTPAQKMSSAGKSPFGKSGS